MIKGVDLLSGVMMALKKVLLVSFWIDVAWLSQP